MPTASVILPARDAAATIAGALAALSRQELDGGFEVIVVDNGSVDDTAALAERSGVAARVIQRPRGDGPGAARNAGATLASGAVLAFLDADCIPASGWLGHGVAALAESDLVQGRVAPASGVEVGPYDRTLSVSGAYGLFESANLFVTRKLFERLGGFDDGLEQTGPRGPRVGQPFGEDVIFGWRARRSGARTGFSEQALAYHAVFPRGPGEFVAERRRLAMFPELAARVPELRDGFFYRRFFHSGRSARFDLALAGLGASLATRRAMPLLVALPYLGTVGNEVRRWGLRTAPRVAAVEVLADAVGAVALVRGSVGARTVLL